MPRGELRIYLGAAPGVGKTYAMLCEAHRRASRGTDVVIGAADPHGRQRVREQLEGLECTPGERGPDAPGELDVDALLERGPDVAVVDDLAHVNPAGSRNPRRCDDVEELLDAGITVLTTVNIGQLESMNDLVQRITGVEETAIVPDAMVRRAEQVELIDMTPEALRRRVAHGNVLPRDQVGSSLNGYFSFGSLAALRELALLWLADKVDDQLDRYRAEQGIAGQWEARERIVVALADGPEAEALVRRGARVAARAKGADLMAVHVSPDRSLRQDDPSLADQRRLVEDLGGTFYVVGGGDVARALVEFARSVSATQLVIGTSRRGRLGRIVSPGVGVKAAALAGSIDVHLVSTEENDEHRPQSTR